MRFLTFTARNHAQLWIASRHSAASDWARRGGVAFEMPNCLQIAATDATVGLSPRGRDAILDLRFWIVDCGGVSNARVCAAVQRRWTHGGVEGWKDARLHRRTRYATTLHRGSFRSNRRHSIGIVEEALLLLAILPPQSSSQPVSRPFRVGHVQSQIHNHQSPMRRVYLRVGGGIMGR